MIQRCRPSRGNGVSGFGVIAMLLAVSGPVGLPDPMSPLSLLMPVCAAGVFLTQKSVLFGK